MLPTQILISFRFVLSLTPTPELDRLPSLGRRPGLAKKPAPDIFLAAADAIGLSPADCLVIEDADKGLRAAQAAGTPCIILRTPQNREFDFKGQDAMASSLGEIQEALERVSTG